MGNTSNWDDGKKKWSETKDDLLSHYLPVFFQKLYMKNSPILYVDGFSGPGIYGDGAKGSPLIALECAAEARRQSRSRSVPRADFIFSEKSAKRSESLRRAIDGDPLFACFSENAHIDRSGYSSVISDAMLRSSRYGTMFFYVDPFGISDLDFETFSAISKVNGEHSPGVEVLLNFNSVGYLREACCVMKLEGKIPEGTDDSAEPAVGSTQEREDRLSRILGDDSWRPVLDDLGRGSIDFWEAETSITERLTDGLSKAGFTFVLNMPIRDFTKMVGKGGLLKYRMVHMTNHWMGCAAMNDNMVGRFSSSATPQLFQADVSGNLVSDERIIEEATSLVRSAKSGFKFPMGLLATCVASNVGVVKKIHDICAMTVPRLEEEGLVERVVKLTPSGRAKHSYDEEDELIIK